MKFYGGNTRRIIKKHAFFNFDGVNYGWDTGLEILELASRLQPGHIIYNSFTNTWDTILKVEFQKFHIHHYYRGERKTKGWWIGEFIIHAKHGDKTYWIRDIEHWMASGWRQDADLSRAIEFNRQIGLPDDYVPAHIKRWLANPDWEQKE
jgi:hypothetical protein